MSVRAMWRRVKVELPHSFRTEFYLHRGRLGRPHTLCVWIDLPAAESGEFLSLKSMILCLESLIVLLPMSLRMLVISSLSYVLDDLCKLVV